jgi:hypothetical protein
MGISYPTGGALCLSPSATECSKVQQQLHPDVESLRQIGLFDSQVRGMPNPSLRRFLGQVTLNVKSIPAS